MTVFVTYKPTYHDAIPDVNRPTYICGWESVGAAAIEVYEIDDETRVRTLVDQSDYSIEFHGGERTPTKEDATITFNREHPSNITRVSLLRNTLIEQVTDMPNVRSFNTRMLEFTVDKVTMICQEMVARKCTAFTATPITQEITFGSYRALEAGAVQAALDKLSTIINEIAATAAPCQPTEEAA
jgi:hypothetical protein